MDKITKGEWKVLTQGEADEFCMITADGRWIFSFRQNGELYTEEELANARAISAVPELLKLAQHILAMSDDAYFMDHPEWTEIVNEAKQAINKTE